MSKISIIVPMYNAENYIKKCLDSLVNQTLKDIEIIIVNDGSEDNSENIVREYMKEYKNIVLINQKNSGQAIARNEAIKVAKGEFVCFVDSDDWIDKDMCKTLYKHNENDIVYCNYIWYYEGGNYSIASNIYDGICDEKAKYIFNNAGPCYKIIRRSLIIENKLFFPEGIIYEDSAVMPVLALYTNKIKYINEPLYYYFQRNGSTMNVEKFSNKLLDVYKAMEVLEDNFKKADKENAYSQELEYLFVQYYLIAAGMRFLKFNKYTELDKISNIMKEKYPKYKNNKYYNLLTKKEKIISELIYTKHCRLLKFLMKIKKTINGIRNIKESIKKSLFRIKNIIILESSPDFADNTKALFDNMIEQGINKKYKLVWLVNKTEKPKTNIKNVKYVYREHKRKSFEHIRYIYYIYSAKIIIDGNDYVQKIRDEQIRIHIGHGMPIKKVMNYCRSIGEFDYLLSTSKNFENELSHIYLTEPEKFVHLGYCRNDELILKEESLELLPEKWKDSKLIVWLPTYREHKSNNEQSSLKYGIPCFDTEEDLIKCNEVLKQNNTKLLIKLHPAQSTNELSKVNLSNFELITDQELREMGISLYTLLSMSSALITDYSSVYYDYLITQKPIGLAIADLEEYNKKFGFVYDNYYDAIKGEYIYTLEDMNKFIDNLDDLSSQKEIIKERAYMYNDYLDNKNSERVCNFIKKFL